MKIPSPHLLSPNVQDASERPARPLSAPPTLARQDPVRRHHANSTGFLRRLGGAQQTASVSQTDGASQATPLVSLLQRLCDVMRAMMRDGASHDGLAELLQAGWHDAPRHPESDITVRHAWPFTAAGCAMSGARMHCHAHDGRLQQLSLDLQGEPLDVASLATQFGPPQVSPASRDGMRRELVLAFDQPWGRLGVVVNANQTIVHSLVVVPRDAAVEPPT